ncbi:MAG: phospholipid carrier-dependent glycosyltransferase [Actinomycetota bacterium]
MRGHAPFAAVFVAGTVLRFLVLLAYQPILMLQRDTYVYLSIAEGDTAGGFRPALYPMLIRPAVALGNLTAVAVTQHLLGLAMGLLTYLVLRRLGAGRWLGAAASAVVLLDGYQLNLEQYLLTETVFQALALGAAALLLWRARPAVWLVALAGVLLGLTGLTRFVGVVLILPAVVYVVWARLGWRRLAALLIGFAVPLGFYSSLFENRAGDAAITSRNGFFLYGRVASFADCRDVEVPSDLRYLCFEEPPEERGPNYGVFALDVPINEWVSDPGANSDMLRFSRRMILAQPLDYARVVLSDLWRYAEPAAPTSQEPHAQRWTFVSSLEEAEPHPLVRGHGGSPPPESGVDQTFRIDAPIAKGLAEVQRLAYLWGPLLAISILLGLAGAVAGPPAGEGRSMRAVCAFFSLTALVLLAVPVMTTVYHFRYVIAPLPFIGPAGAMGLLSLRARLSGRESGHATRNRAGPSSDALTEAAGGRESESGLAAPRS